MYGDERDIGPATCTAIVMMAISGREIAARADTGKDEHGTADGPAGAGHRRGSGLGAAIAAAFTAGRGGGGAGHDGGTPRATARADITDDDAVQAAVQSAAERLGGLDVLVNNAGIGAQGSVEQSTDADGSGCWT